MHIYLMRHGQAVTPSENPQRPLSIEGEKQVKSVAQFLKGKELIVIGEIWHSTKLRAKQTAEIFSKELKLAAPSKQISSIEPDDEASRMVEDLAKIIHPVLIVGHMPYLGLLMSLLVSGRPGTNAFQFEEAAIACLTLNSGRGGPSPQGKIWALQWKVSPSLIQTQSMI